MSSPLRSVRLSSLTLGPSFVAWLTALLLPTTVVGELLPLRAGPLSMVFDTESAFLRYVRVGPHEVLRGVNAPVRNQFWGTVPPQVSNLRHTQSEHSFELSFDVTCHEHEIKFTWHGTITGDSSGSVEMTFDGEAGSTFLRNRIGFCILHGPTAAGKRWIIEHIDGHETRGSFPTAIAPHQPAKQIRALAHEFSAGLWAHVRCEGETFEMEDQRNWTDASFKTYCTPLELPYPVEVPRGTKISQRIRIHLSGDLGALEAQPADPASTVRLTLTKSAPAAHTLPGIGLQLPATVTPLSKLDVARLQALRLDHLRLDLDLAAQDFQERLRQAAELAALLDCKLYVALHPGLKPAQEFSRLVAAVETIGPPVAAWIVITADEATVVQAAKQLRTELPEARIGVGHDTNFTELNRNRPQDPHIEVVSYGFNPQVHATYPKSMFETLEIQPETVRTARQFVGKRSLLISPVTLRVQSVGRATLPGQLPSNVDSRQTSQMAAAWTLGSLCHLAETEIEAVTYFQTVGWQGVMTASQQPRPHPEFPANPGEVFALYHVLRDVGEFSHGIVQPTSTSNTLAAAGITIAKAGRQRTLVANLQDHPQDLLIEGLGNEVSVFHMNRGNVARARQRAEQFASRAGTGVATNQGELAVQLPAYGIVRIDQAAGTQPYGGQPHQIPGTVEAEHYDEGEPGLAFQDIDKVNHGADYRGPTHVDIEKRPDASNGHGLGWTHKGEWVVYTVAIQEPGAYDIEIPVASNKQGGTFHLEVSGQDVSGPIAVPDTGGWQKLKLIRVENVRLPQGVHVMRMVMDTEGPSGSIGDIDLLRFKRAGGR